MKTWLISELQEQGTALKVVELLGCKPCWFLKVLKPLPHLLQDEEAQHPNHAEAHLKKEWWEIGKTY